MNKILVAHEKLGKFTIEHIDGSVPLKTLQEAVGGYIEVAHIRELDRKGIAIIANEEGILIGLEPNENIFPFFFVGAIVFVAIQDEDIVGLNNSQLQFLTEWIRGLQEI